MSLTKTHLEETIRRLEEQLMLALKQLREASLQEDLDFYGNRVMQLKGDIYELNRVLYGS